MAVEIEVFVLGQKRILDACYVTKSLIEAGNVSITKVGFYVKIEWFVFCR